MMKYVLGVDGGNSKTDYLLHDLEGQLVARLRAGTCSHERLGMRGAREEMHARIVDLLKKAGAAQNEIAAAAFGLAGVDQSAQKRALEDIVRQIGLQTFVVMNDSFLGIKAGSDTGVGVCSVNGAGTSAGGIDSQGRWVQVGGYGAAVSGDEAGGGYIARRVLRAAYDAVYRFGPQTALLPRVLAFFGCGAEEFHEAVSVKFLEGSEIRPLTLVQLLFTACNEGDEEAMRIVASIADTLARNAAGCAVRLSFGKTVPVVLIGSVWTKGQNPLMLRHFAEQFEKYTQKKPALHILDTPPAAGSVLWALELAHGCVPSTALRQTVLGETRGL